jgi:hypothetical protein
MRRLILPLVTALVLASCMGKSGSMDAAKNIQISDNGIVPGAWPAGTVGLGPVYQNHSVPQDFSLQMPVLTTPGTNTIDLGRCYMDYAPGAISLDSHTRRLCGLQFTQVQLELRALFLDLALPDIRAYCHNRLENCDLSSQEFTITVSEPVMRRVEKLFEFYRYTGLEGYFQYNGYAIRNGAKIPFRINTYEESCVDRFDYRAVIRTRVIGTYGGEAQVRDNAGDVVIYWDRQRKNILMDFRTSVELFGFQINLRRTYDFADRATGVRYTSSVHYWTSSGQGSAGESTLVHGNAVVAEPCDNSNSTCTKMRHIASEYVGNDADRNGLSAAESYYDALRFSEGVIDANGGIIDSYLSAAGSRSKERIAFSGTSTVDLQIYGTPGSPFAMPGTPNAYITRYATPGRLNISLLAQVHAGFVPERSLVYLADHNAADATRVRGLAAGGASDNLILRWANVTYQQSTFNYAGGQAYRAIHTPQDQVHPLY